MKLVTVRVPEEIEELARRAGTPLNEFIEVALKNIKLIPREDDTAALLVEPTVVYGRKRLPAVIELYAPPRPYPQMTHPLLAKMLIEEYTEKGWVVLDCFCGTGVIPLVASHLGRNGVGVDIRKPSLALNALSEYVSEALGEEVLATYTRIQGDFFHLPLRKADAIITSPPYGTPIDGKAKSPLERFSTYLQAVKEFWKKVMELDARVVVLIVGAEKERGFVFPAFAYWAVYSPAPPQRIHVYLEPKKFEIIYVFRML